MKLWPQEISSAKQIQILLSRKVKLRPLMKEPEYIAAVDAAYTSEKIIAIASLYEYRGLIHREDNFCIKSSNFPYIPGFLSFREGPAIMGALKKFKIKPDLVIFDGQGIAHPEGIGIASHLGVILNLPTIGCAKSRLVGEYKKPGNKKGDYSYLYYKHKKVGFVLRTKEGVKPLFVSPGHLVDLPSSYEIILNCLTEYRLPEPQRRVDQLSRKLRKLLDI